MLEKEIVELGYEVIEFASDHERTILCPGRALVLIRVAFVSHHDHASRYERRARVPHLILEGNTSNLRVRHPSSVPKVIVHCLCTRAGVTMQHVHFSYARAIGRYEQLGLELPDEGGRCVLVVRGDEKDTVDDLLECTIPVGCPERSSLGARVAEGLRVLLLPIDVRVVAQTIVEPKELHCEVGKADIDAKEGIIKRFGIVRVYTGRRSVDEIVGSVDLWEDELPEDIAEVRKVLDSEIIEVFKGLW